MSQPHVSNQLAIVPSDDYTLIKGLTNENNSLAFNQSLATLTADLVGDIFFAYGLSLVEMSDRVRHIYLTQLSSTRKTFPYLMEVILSDRHPFTIMKLACKLGMYLPTHHRVGLKTYRFYLMNIQHYENTFERTNCRVPSLFEISLMKNPINYLMKFRDEEILQPGYKFNRNYNDRRAMIANFVELNITSQGDFELPSNSRRYYNCRDKNILYSEGSNKFLYGISDLLKLCDFEKRVVWTDCQKQKSFSKFSLHRLRQKILEKLSQWKQFDHMQSNQTCPDLYKLYCHLDDILSSDSRNDVGSYLGHPKISVKF